MPAGKGYEVLTINVPEGAGDDLRREASAHKLDRSAYTWGLIQLARFPERQERFALRDEIRAVNKALIEMKPGLDQAAALGREVHALQGEVRQAVVTLQAAQRTTVDCLRWAIIAAVVGWSTLTAVLAYLVATTWA